MRLVVAITTCCAAFTITTATLAASPLDHSEHGIVTHKNLEPGGAPPSPFRHAQGQILVKFRDSTSSFTRALAHMQVGTTVVKEFKAVKGLQLLKLGTGTSVSQALKAFGKMPEVLYAEPNYVVDAFATPNDPSYTQLWGLNNTGQTGGTPGADVHAPQAWDLTTGSANPVIAIIDTGIDYTHPDLAANLYHTTAGCDASVSGCFGINAITGSGDPMDDNKHGTHVAGTIGAVGNNATGVVGVNWTTSLLACKFLDTNGSGYLSDAITCLDYVAAQKDSGVNIVASSNSWGGGAYSQSLSDAIDAQRQRGILFVVAAGNSGSDNDTSLTYPCSYYLPNILCVAATNASDQRSSFSNYGKRTVHLGAPGESILSTVPAAFGSYLSLSGTSMATPHVTGTVGLIHALYPGADWRAVKNRLLAGGDTESALAQTITGRRLNAYGALSCNNQVVLSRLRPLGTSLSVGMGPIKLAALHINCADPNGNVTVNVSNGDVVTLNDDGLSNDQVTGDGVYSGSWTPPAGGTYTLSFPGGDNVTASVDGDLMGGFPVKAWHGGGSYTGGPVIHTLVTNANGTTGQQIFVTSTASGPLNAWDATGAPLSGWPIFTSGAVYPAAAKLSSSNGNDIASGSWGVPGWLSANNSAAAFLPGWPRYSANYVTSPPASADIDGDGVDEIFIGEEDWKLHAYRADGTPLSGWPVNFSSGGQTRHTPAIADLFGDGKLEIATTSGSISPGGVTLNVLHSDGSAVSGFPVSFSAPNNPFPAIGDVDGDGKPEIIVVGSGPTVLIYGNNGVLKRSIPLTGTVSYGAAPALADLDGDGIPEIIVQTNEALNVVRGDGSTYPGWPVSWGSGYWAGNSAPVVGDVDGDGIADIVVTSQSAGSGTNGVVRVYRRDGSSHPHFPKTLPIGAGAVPTIADITGDGRNKIVIAGDYWDGYSGYYDKVWVYDLGGTLAYGPVLWGGFMGNAKHTGTAAPQSVPPPPPPPTYYTLNVSNPGNGSVTSNPTGIDCGSRCSASYISGTSVVLTASPNIGYQFNGWSGACSGLNLGCTLLMDADKTAVVEFVAIQYLLTVSRTGSGSGTVTSTPSGIDCGTICSASYNANTTVTLGASATSGSTFAGWSGACTGAGSTCTVSMDSAKSVTAQFVPAQYVLTVSRNGSGSGTVTSNPSGISCGTGCSASYDANTSVMLSANAANGSRFAGWGGACSGSSSTCTLSMTAVQSVTATFNKPGNR